MRVQSYVHTTQEVAHILCGCYAYSVLTVTYWLLALPFYLLWSWSRVFGSTPRYCRYSCAAVGRCTADMTYDTWCVLKLSHVSFSLVHTSMVHSETRLHGSRRQRVVRPSTTMHASRPPAPHLRAGSPSGCRFHKGRCSSRAPAAPDAPSVRLVLAVRGCLPPPHGLQRVQQGGREVHQETRATHHHVGPEAAVLAHRRSHCAPHAAQGDSVARAGRPRHHHK